MKSIGDSRSTLTQRDCAFFMDQTGLSQSQVESIFDIFNKKGDFWKCL